MFPVRRSGDRVLLREWQPTEVDGLHRWLGDPVVHAFLSWGTSSRTESGSHLHGIIESQRVDPRTAYHLAVERLAAPGVTIGGAGLHWVDEDRAEIGYFLEATHWGEGYGSDAAGLVLDLAFDLGAVEAIATCDAANAASEAVMRRCGMTRKPTGDPHRRTYTKRHD